MVDWDRVWMRHRVRNKVRDRDWNWDWHFVVLLADVLDYVLTFVIISYLLYYLEVLIALGSGSFCTNLPWALPGGGVAFLLDSGVAPSLDLFTVLNFCCWLANSFKHLLAKFPYSGIIASGHTTLLYILGDLTLRPETWVISVTIALVLAH